jgi:hypothetical protein
LAAGHSDSDHHPSCHFLALRETSMSVNTEVIYADVAPIDHGRSGLSWGSIIGGALATIAVSLILVSLAAGLGLTSFSVYAGNNAKAATYGISAGLALLVVQWLSAAFGGYIAGRTRARWSALHTHESGFRDTAHGFLSWALATALTLGMLALAGGTALSGALHGATTLGAAGVTAAGHEAGPMGDRSMGDPIAALTDRLFRIEQPTAAATAASGTSSTGTAATTSQAAAAPIPATVAVRATPDMRAEAGRILATQLTDGAIADADKAYLAQEIAQVTGLPPAEAQKRVADASAALTEAENKAKAAAEAARKAAATGAFFTAFSLLIGAFIAAAAGAVGGHRRELNAAVRLR